MALNFGAPANQTLYQCKAFKKLLISIVSAHWYVTNGMDHSQEEGTMFVSQILMKLSTFEDNKCAFDKKRARNTRGLKN